MSGAGNPLIEELYGGSGRRPLILIAMVVQICGVVHAVFRQNWHTAPWTRGGWHMIDLTDEQGSVEIHWTNMCEAISLGTRRIRRSWIWSTRGSRFGSTGDSWFSRDRVNDKRTVVRSSENFRFVGLLYQRLCIGLSKGGALQSGELHNTETNM